MAGSPFPSHPTVRAVFPHTAVRQSSCPGLHRCFLIPDHPAAHVEDASGVQGTIWIALPSKPTVLTATGQVASKAYIDEALQGPKGLPGIGVAIVVHPPPHHLIHLLHKFRRRHRSAPFGAGLYAPPYAALRRLTGKDVDRILSAGWAASLHDVAPEEVQALHQFRDAGLVAIERQTHPCRHRGTRLERLRCTGATDQDGIIGIAMPRGPHLLRVAPLMPHLVQQVQGDVALQR